LNKAIKEANCSTSFTIEFFIDHHIIQFLNGIKLIKQVLINLLSISHIFKPRYLRFLFFYLLN